VPRAYGVALIHSRPVLVAYSVLSPALALTQSWEKKVAAVVTHRRLSARQLEGVIAVHTAFNADWPTLETGPTLGVLLTGARSWIGDLDFLLRRRGLAVIGANGLVDALDWQVGLNNFAWRIHQILFSR